MNELKAMCLSNCFKTGGKNAWYGGSYQAVFPVSTVKPVLSSHSKADQKLDFKVDNLLMQVKHSAILSTFIKLPFVIKIFVLSIFD